MARHQGLPVCTEFLLKSVGDCAPKAVKAEVLLADSDSDDPKDEDDDPNENGDDPNVDLESDIDDPKGGRWRERERSSARICSSPESEAITLRLMLYPDKLPFPPPKTYTIYQSLIRQFEKYDSEYLPFIVVWSPVLSNSTPLFVDRPYFCSVALKKREHDECSALTQLKAFVKTKLHIQNFDHSSATMQCNAMQRLKSIHEFANSQIAKIWINDHLFFSL